MGVGGAKGAGEKVSLATIGEKWDFREKIIDFLARLCTLGKLLPEYLQKLPEYLRKLPEYFPILVEYLGKNQEEFCG